LTEHSEDELQALLSQIPIERIVKIEGKMSKVEAQNKYLECFMDRNKEAVFDAEKNMILIERRANIKVMLRTEKDKEKRKSLENEMNEITEKMRL